MTEWKRMLGVDLFDTLVHGTFTVALITSLSKHGVRLDLLVLIGCASLLVYAVRRALVLRRMGGASTLGAKTPGALGESALEGRLAALESLHARVAELEERQDFSERLLAQRNEPARLERPQ